MNLDLDSMLVKWGVWHKTFIRGLDCQSVNHASSGSSSNYNKEKSDRVSFKEDPESERLDMIIKHLRFVHKEEMQDVRDFYINDKSLRSIGTELGISRGKVLKVMDRAKDLLESHYRVELFRQGRMGS